MDKKQGIGIALGTFAVIAGIAVASKKEEEFPEDIVLSDLRIIPSEVEIGEPVEISCIAYNAGDERATRKITLEVT